MKIPCFAIPFGILITLLASQPAHSGSAQQEEKQQPITRTKPLSEVGLALAVPDLVVSVENGVCASNMAWADIGQEKILDAYAQECAHIFVEPKAIVSTPGLLFIGGAFGSTSSQFLLGPSAAIGAGASIPIIRPTLTYRESKSNKVEFILPRRTSFTMNFLVSGNVGVAGMLFPNAGGSDQPAPAEIGFTVGLYGAPEFAWISYDPAAQQRYRIGFSLGVIAGYLGGSSTVGPAFIVGVQPGLVINFAP
ncbi:hypothetical protein [Archangium primigenium]|uniref:hypothetical protein n=1 Tax=[Archangium] primigenium TaxID=2792470 RepID=UPI0019578D28|nr:hypothetical protein [Archangium primigenium]MBM7116065.1 hypothetical protein [Archangium primigenium]